jgi:hypothetical protein
MLKGCSVLSSMRLGAPFIAPRQLGAVESKSGRPLLPSVVGRTGQSGAHRTVSGARFPSLNSEADRWQTWSRWRTGHVRCTPDSPVNYSRTPSANSREQPLHSRQPGAPDTVRCTTGQSGAPDRNSHLAVHSQLFSFLLLSVSNT